jgi:eukaryotic-like serine/threonine-protein kinase
MQDATQPVTTAEGGGSAQSSGPDIVADLTGKLVGDFHILRRLGQGGMGSVYLAEQRSLKRKVALKFLRPEFAANPTAVSRFRREAEAVARVTHVNIVQVYYINADKPPYFMALEYVEGRNLGKYLSQKGPPDLPFALAIMRQVAAALQRAAESGIVHRDIKPENILLTRKTEVKVADFGLSRDLTGDEDLSLTQPGIAMGTPLYMSPEQAQGKSLDPRSDIYSFGVTCYHMLAGQTPFRGKTAFEVALKHVNEQPPPLEEIRPDLPPVLIDLIRRMMSKDPADRPQSARDVLRELTLPVGSASSSNPFAGLGVTAAEPIRTIAPTAAPSQTKSFRARAWLTGALAVLFAGAAGIGVRLFVSAHSVRSVHDDHPVLPIVSEQERWLLSAVSRYATPKLGDARQGGGYHVELGVLYWEQRRYEDAERLFDDMIRRPNVPPIYKTVGSLGLAITYSLRDEVDRSNKLFFEIRGSGAAGRPLVPPNSLPPEDAVNLRYWVATALDRNATRPPVPKELDELRKEQRRRPNLGAGAKPG